MVDVARRAGVSRALVSLVLRGKPGASATNRAKVMAAAAELGYTPDLNARRLRAGTERLVGVVFDGHDPFTAAVLDRAHQAVAQRGQDLVLTMSSGCVPLARALSTLADQRVSSLLIISSAPVDARAATLLARTPCAFIGAYAPTGVEDLTSSVHSDDAAGMRALVAHLAGQGHRRVAVTHVLGRRSGQVRAQAAVSAAQEHGLEAVQIPAHGYDEGAGARAAQELVALRPRPTAFLAANDAMALAAVHVLRSAGLRVPQDVSVTGFDDAATGPTSAVAVLGLTTVRQDVEQIVSLGLDLVAEVAAGRRAHEHVVLAPELVVRSSTCPPG